MSQPSSNRQGVEIHLSVLASGSGGNCTYINFSKSTTIQNSSSFLIDLGIGPRTLHQRCRSLGIFPQTIRFIVLTHTHSDHWNERSFSFLLQNKIIFYCHRDHSEELSSMSDRFRQLMKANLIRHYSNDEDFSPTPGLIVRAKHVPHDRSPTFAFQMQFSANPRTSSSSQGVQGVHLGYATDLGNFPDSLIDFFRNLDLLLLEFNHDIQMLRNSNRPDFLINRILSGEGHLSNHQACEFLKKIIEKSDERKLRYLFQLHLSRDCNLPEIAHKEATNVLNNLMMQTDIFTAHQNIPTPLLFLENLSTSHSTHSSS